jgi:hypothetical protein
MSFERRTHVNGRHLSSSRIASTHIACSRFPEFVTL